jgi:sec-independent protein translocase protein TatA
MPRPPGPLELVLILVIVVLLFGVGRISKISGEIGASIREFRRGLNPEKRAEPKPETKPDEDQK